MFTVNDVRLGYGPNKILIVDDTPANLHLLTSILSGSEYEVRAVLSGQMALTAVKATSPDLILLDINMPLMNGYEVCQILKADSQTCEIPILFISALDEVTDKVKAFEVGGVDYITKPFQIAEVLARVEVHLHLRQLQRHLQAQNIRLQQEMDARQQAEEKYRSIFENCLEGIFQMTGDGHYLSANLALAKIYGYESVQSFLTPAVEQECERYLRPRRQEELKAYLHQHRQVSEFESQVYRKDGSVIWISETLREIRNADDQLVYYEGITQDITERKQTEVELHHQRYATEQLLLSILPQTIAERLKQKQETIADSFEEVTMLFADVVNFTSLAARISPTALVELLNQIFSTFDQLANLQNSMV